MTKPTVIDIFGAPGGMSEGFRQAGFKILAAIDLFDRGVESLKTNHKKALVLKEDLTKFDFEGLKKDLEDTPSVIIGGPPCQGFSSAGMPKIASLNGGNGYKDPRNKLYNTYLKAVKIFQPEFFVMENVRGILSYDNGKVKKNILNSRYVKGYEVEADVLNAAEYGVPQSRKRAFFIGNRIGLDENLFPEETHGTEKDRKENRKLKPFVTLWDAISDLPVLKSGSGIDETEYKSKPKNPYQRSMRAWSKKLHDHVARPHNDRDLNIFKIIKNGCNYRELPKKLKPYRDDIFKDKYRVLPMNKPSYTIVAHLQKDGLAFIHPTQNRSISVREAARLQSFSDRYRFGGPRTWQFHQIGNAVPPLLAKAIAKNLKKHL